MTKSSQILFVLIAMLFVSCASVNYDTQSADLDAKKFSPAPNKSYIYIFRKAFIGYTELTKVMIDGKIIGGLATSSYMLVEVSPGKHTVSSSTDESFDTIEIDAEDSRAYFFEQNVYTGVFGMRVKLEQTGSKYGKNAVLKYKRVKSFY